jgi:hypothetical protein
VKNLSSTTNQIQYVHSFQDLVSKPFQGEVNAICWTRQLEGDFEEIVNKIISNETIINLDINGLFELELSEQGKIARDRLLNDFNLLKAHGASPSLNLITCYERDNTYPFFPTDVYSFHVDRSPISTDTFLCTYHGESSELLPNSQATQKVLIPEIRNELKKIHHGKEQEFDSFILDHFFDLHYLPKANAHPISLGIGHLWRLAVDHPESKVLPCIHRAPQEIDGQKRLLMIC